MGPVLARGAHAQVRLARRRGTDAPWLALKQPRPDRGEEAVAHVRREAALLPGLLHPGIIPADATDAGTRPFVATPWLPGGDLRRRTGSVGDIARRLRQVAAALDWLHAAGMVHGDVKPANLVLGLDGAARLIDFGGDRMQATRGYASPERLLGLEPAPRDDIFSMAAVIWNWLTGQPPYATDPLLCLEAPVAPVGLAARAWPCLRAALAPARDARPSSAAELIAACAEDPCRA